MAISKNGYSCELDFLTNIPMLNNNENRDTIWNQLQGGITIDGYNKETDEYIITKTKEQKIHRRVTVYKGNKDGKTINYYKEKIFNNQNVNPYLKLMMDFEADGFESVRLESADFAYLTKLGVYPLNRLWILRRFKEEDTVPDNLLDWGENPPYPISTVVGWIPPEETNFFGVSFNEDWKTQSERIDQVLSKILNDEFKFKTSSVMPIPGFSQGLLMGFLKQMKAKGGGEGLTNFSFDEIPFGNPNVLMEAATRVTDPNSTTYGLKSELSVTLKTGYEQKFIGDVDPGEAMQDILRNLTRMGTSDVIYFAPKETGVLNSLRKASAKGNDADAWWKFIKDVVDAFISAISSLFDKLNDVVKPDKNGNDSESEDEGEGKGKGKSKSIAKKKKSITLVKGLIETLLSSTIAKWKWPLKAGLGVMTGENTTPWHLTIGNPYSPFVSLGNIKVSKVIVNWNNEIGFNDVPNRMDVTINVSFGRNLGAQEIFAMFNKGYTRVYDTIDKKHMSLSKLYKVKTDDNNKSGVAETNKVSTTKN